MWRFAAAGQISTTGHTSSELFDAIAEVATVQLRSILPRDLANTVWAFAKAIHASPVVFEAMAEVTRPRSKDFSSQDLAKIV